MTEQAGDDCHSLLQPSCYASLQRRHDEGDHLLVFEGGGFITYLSVPPLPSHPVDEEGKLCFLDHRMESRDPMPDMCCLREAGHVHAHVHRGEITEDILLEQCMEEAGCTLPMPWDLATVRTPVPSGDENDSDHEHQEGCGHNRIAHGDHFDWLIPLKDGSYVLSHAQATASGRSQFIEHGRLVKVGESLGQLKRRPKQLIDLFTYEVPKRKGYETLTTTEEEPRKIDTDIVAIVKSPSHGCIALSSPKQAVLQEDMKLMIPRGFKSQGLTRTTFDVMGICCPAEVPLVKKILAPVPGVEEVLVNVTSKTVTVLHDPTIVADVQLVKILNEARLDASIHHRGKQRMSYRWPSPWTIGSGVLLLISFLHYAWPPLKWVALGAVAVGVPPILVRSLVALRRCVLDINVLMIIAVGGAIALGDYVEAGSIAFLFTLADWLESRSTDKARDAISNVADLAPQTAVLMDGKRVVVEDVGIGALLAVKAGELIPIDGEVVSGKSSIDESTVTGESKPVEKTMGAVVWAGTMNLSGYISVKTTALAEDSAVSRMVRLVEEAQNQHSPTEHLVEKVAKYYTPLVVLSAVLIAVIPLAAGSHHHKHWIYLALVLLVVACPCALVISTPVTTTCGIAQAARAGLLVRGGTYLEALAKVKVLAMDKTGTLTEGHFRVLDVFAVDNATSVQQILYWIACVESKSSHPLAPALVAYARIHGVEPTGHITDFEIIPGLGVSAVVDGHKVEIGNTRLTANFTGLEDINFSIIETWSSQGATVGWVGINGRPVGVFGVADSVRPEAFEAVASLKKLGMRVVMLTGDSAAAASAAHNQIGDIEVHSELLPENKVTLVKELKGTGVTAMVGDGINDAPALALADIGIAMGVAGSAVAMETADVALMINDLRKLSVAIKLGQDVRRKIIQNVTLSFLTKVTIIILAAAGYPSLWGAVVADVGTCLAVIFNSMRLLNRKKGVVLPKFESRKHQDHNHGNHCYAQEHKDEHAETGNDHQHDQQELGKIGEYHHGQLCKSASGSERTLSNRKCCARPCLENNCSGDMSPLDNNKCCSKTDHRGDSKICPKVNLKGQAGAVTTGGSHCCSGQNLEKKCCPISEHTTGWFSNKKICKSAAPSEATLSNRKCCTKPNLENNCCADMRDPIDTNRCGTRQGQDSKSCRKVNLKPQASPTIEGGSHCCSGKDLEKKCCPVLEHTAGWSSNKKVCNSASSSEITQCNRKCSTKLSTKPDIENNCCADMTDPLDNNKCCTGQGRDRKSCPKVNLKAQVSTPTAGSSQCCSGQNLEKKCSLSLEHTTGWSTDKKSCKSAPASETTLSNRKCSTNPDIENNCGVDTREPVNNNRCCVGRGQDSKSCPKVTLNAQVSPTTADSSHYCTGEDLEKKCCPVSQHTAGQSNNRITFKSASASETTPSRRKYSTKPDIENKCSVDMRDSLNSKQCCTGQGRDSKSKINLAVPASSTIEGGTQCCSGQDLEKECCTDTDQKLKAASCKLDGHLTVSVHRGQHHHHDRRRMHEPIHKSSGSSHPNSYSDETSGSPGSHCEKGAVGIPLRVICRETGMKDCCLRDLSQVPPDKDGDRDTECCGFNSSCSQSITHCGSVSLLTESAGLSTSDYDMAKPHAKETTLENFRSCIMLRCKSADHSKCATEALVHSPLRDLSSFTRPISPL